jgi:hypothetical protein
MTRKQSPEHRGRGAEAKEVGVVEGNLSKSSYPTTSPQSTQAPQFSVSDGREAVGVVIAYGKRWKAFNPDGTLVGIFKSLRQASRALPSRRIS